MSPKAVVEEWVRRFNAGDVDGLAHLYAEDAVNHQVVMEPLDSDVEDYLKLKFERVGAKLTDVFEPDALDAIRARLIHKTTGHRTNEVVSICYPQVVNNLVCRALNAAAANGFSKVDAQVIEGC